jgi:hypothetical protein
VFAAFCLTGGVLEEALKREEGANEKAGTADSVAKEAVGTSWRGAGGAENVVEVAGGAEKVTKGAGGGGATKATGAEGATKSRPAYIILLPTTRRPESVYLMPFRRNPPVGRRGHWSLSRFVTA